MSGLSNSELDRLCGLRKGHTRAIETNPEANPTIETTRKIAEAFGVTVGYLASGEGAPPLAWAVAKAIAVARGEETAEAAAEPAPTFHDPPASTGTDGVG